MDGFDHEGQPPELCSQAFYDDCRAALRADGMLVANLHTAHPEFSRHVARIERAFDGDALFVGDGECSNTIAFAGSGLSAGSARPGVLRKPGPLDRQAWDDLMPAFARVVGALHEQRSGAQGRTDR